MLEPGSSVLCTAGSVDFYSTYPGAHVPQPIGLRHLDPTRSASQLAAEVLTLTKINWNQTRLDGLLPVTLRTAEQVKRVLRFCDPAALVAMRYAHYNVARLLATRLRRTQAQPSVSRQVPEVLLQCATDRTDGVRAGLIVATDMGLNMSQMGIPWRWLIPEPPAVPARQGR